MELAGYIASIFVGVSLGLIGGGGSILTVPVLVYLFSVDSVDATTYSLFVVGTTSVAGSFFYLKRGLVDIKTVFLLGLPSTLAVFLTRAFILPAIPTQLFRVGGFTLTKGILLLLVFALLMLIAAYGMIKKDKMPAAQKPEQTFNHAQVIFQGLGVGLVTGLVGAGGGFLIIPALIHFMRLSMKRAIGTSLVIIAINSLAGFLFSLTQTAIHWTFMLVIAGLAIAGILLGSYISTKIDGKKLKPVFGWFVLVMGLYIILKEIVL